MVAGTIYEATHYAVSSIFLLLSAIKVYRLISTVPKPSLQSISQKKCYTHSCKNTMQNTQVYTAIVSFLKAWRRAKHYEAAVWISPKSTSSQFVFLKSLLLNATSKYSSTSHFQNFKQCISYITFSWCEIPIVLLEHIIKGKNCPSMLTFTVEIRNGS